MSGAGTLWTLATTKYDKIRFLQIRLVFDINICALGRSLPDPESTLLA